MRSLSFDHTLPSRGQRISSVAIACAFAALSGVPSTAQSPVEVAASTSFLEGPTSDWAGNVYFTDIVNQRILKLNTAGAVSVFREHSNVANGLLIDPQGRLIACEGAEFERPGVKLRGTPRVTRTNLDPGALKCSSTAMRVAPSLDRTTSPSTARVGCISPS